MNRVCPLFMQSIFRGDFFVSLDKSITFASSLCLATDERCLPPFHHYYEQEDEL